MGNAEEGVQGGKVRRVYEGNVCGRPKVSESNCFHHCNAAQAHHPFF